MSVGMGGEQGRYTPVAWRLRSLRENFADIDPERKQGRRCGGGMHDALALRARAVSERETICVDYGRDSTHRGAKV